MKYAIRRRFVFTDPATSYDALYADHEGHPERPAHSAVTTIAAASPCSLHSL